MHGGAAGSGAPRGNTNRRSHGRYAAATIARRRQLSVLIADANATLRELGRSAARVGGGGGVGGASGRGETARGQVGLGADPTADPGRQSEDRRSRSGGTGRAADDHRPGPYVGSVVDRRRDDAYPKDDADP